MAKNNQEWKRLLCRVNLANEWYIPNRLWTMCLCEVRRSSYVLVLQETPFFWFCYLTVRYSTTHYSTHYCFNICKQILLFGFQHAIPTPPQRLVPLYQDPDGPTGTFVYIVMWTPMPGGSQKHSRKLLFSFFIDFFLAKPSGQEPILPVFI